MIYSLEDRVPVLEGDGHFIADNATIVGTVKLKTNANVWFNAVLRGDTEWIVVGANSNIQDCAVLHSDPGIPLHIGEFVTAGHKVMLHGCTIGDGTLIGMGAVVLNGAKIGKGCLIGANALVTEGKEIPDYSMVVGQPAKVIRPIDEALAAELRRAADVYKSRQRQYRDGLTEI